MNFAFLFDLLVTLFIAQTQSQKVECIASATDQTCNGDVGTLIGKSGDIIVTGSVDVLVGGSGEINVKGSVGKLTGRSGDIKIGGSVLKSVIGGSGDIKVGGNATVPIVGGSGDISIKGYAASVTGKSGDISVGKSVVNIAIGSGDVKAKSVTSNIEIADKCGGVELDGKDFVCCQMVIACPPAPATITRNGQQVCSQGVFLPNENKDSGKKCPKSCQCGNSAGSSVSATPWIFHLLIVLFVAVLY